VIGFDGSSKTSGACRLAKCETTPTVAGLAYPIFLRLNGRSMVVAPEEGRYAGARDRLRGSLHRRAAYRKVIQNQDERWSDTDWKSESASHVTGEPPDLLSILVFPSEAPF
jgi:hypothetical protein